MDKYKEQKKYGLVWENEKNREKIVEDCKTKLAILEQVKDKEIITDKTKPINWIIEGDNYHALCCLKNTHKEKIDVIYIDPPYNTGAKDWKYNNDYVDKQDKFRHSKWLSFMYDRLLLTKHLLTDDGFIIIAIDHYELFYLGAMCDDIFGEKNRLGIITVVHNPSGRNQAKFFSTNSEYMIVYAKNILYAKFNNVAIDNEVKKSFNLKDDNGNYRLASFMSAKNPSWTKTARPQNYYPIYVSKDFQTFTRKKENGYFEIFPKSKDGKEWTWKNIPKSFDNLNVNKYFSAKSEDNEIVIYHKYREQQIFKNVWTDKKYQSRFHGTKLLKDILNKTIFDYPKSLYLVLDILKITTKKNSIILDFFAGSGTTGHSVLELNKEDGGNRKFILCTSNENNNCDSQGGVAEAVCYPRIKKVIEGYSIDPLKETNAIETAIDLNLMSGSRGSQLLFGFNYKEELKKIASDGEYVAGLGGNLHYFKARFENK